jgi:hypothetical protein
VLAQERQQGQRVDSLWRARFKLFFGVFLATEIEFFGDSSRGRSRGSRRSGCCRCRRVNDRRSRRRRCAGGVGVNVVNFG